MEESAQDSVVLFLADKDKVNRVVNINIIDSQIVNTPPVQSVGLVSASLPIMLSIVLVNTMSIMLIKKRESTLVNTLLIMDCIANVVITVINVVQQYIIVGSEFYCAPVTVLHSVQSTVEIYCFLSIFIFFVKLLIHVLSFSS